MAVLVKRWLSKEEAQEYLGIGKTTLERLTAGGKLHPSKTTDSKYRGGVRYDTQDLDAYMESMRVDSKKRSRRQKAAK